ncbi:surface lipoprotein assembly modifier [Tropicimonas sp. TH_r6]|uniref:surface lipoprotein assembly modifier n=1 Tax=Tropicimonas sp. TH_r6 TaxID=3082085 RepID=UPI002954B23B|nr:surface lipoprotein assembly modifier [Tropicimonas sp. TH_r6]MDV7144273.1 surface lipoprotein assembly modifier [Tropicimonas sp. TH_r6]
MTLPAAHPLISGLTDQQCMACHGGDAPQTTLAVATPMGRQNQKAETQQAQTQDQKRTQEQQQIQQQQQQQQRRALRLGTVDLQDYFERHREDGETGSPTSPKDPWSFRITAGVLASSNIDSHRTSALFHGSTSHSAGLCGTRFWRHTNDEDTGDSAGTRAHVGLRGDYSFDMGEQDRVILGFALNRDRFPEEDLGRTSASLRAAFQHRADSGNLRVSAVLHRAAYDGSGAEDHHDHVAQGLGLNYHHRLSESETLSTCIRLRRRLYEDESEFRTPDFGGSFAYSRSRGTDGRYGFGVALTDRNNPRQASERYFAPSAFAMMDWPLSQGIMGQLSTEFGIRNYDAEDQDSGIVRMDNVWDVGASVLFNDLDIDAAFLRVSCHYTKTTSNIERENRNETYCGAILEKRF